MSTSPTRRFGESLDAGRINPGGFLFPEWVAFFTGIRIGCAFGMRARRCRAEGLFASAVVPEGIPPRAALARRTLWLVKRSSLVVLFRERPADRQWGPGSRLAYRSALFHLKPIFVVASQPPVAPAFCQVAAADLFATVGGYWVVPHTFRDGLCDDEY